MNPAPTAPATGSALISAIETFWSAIVERHPELPAHVIVVTGSGKVSNGLVRGHWAIGRWTDDNAARVPELFVSGERIADGGFGVATTILHEAAHALLQARGDLSGGTSRQGRYHTKGGFAAAAYELGLTPPAKPDSVLGFSDCTLGDSTALDYAAEILLLDAALGARIKMVTREELSAGAIAVGALLGGLNVVIPWWIITDADLAAMWAELGGGLTKVRKPRRQTIKVNVGCGCRNIIVTEAEALNYDDLVCARCGEAFGPH